MLKKISAVMLMCFICTNVKAASPEYEQCYAKAQTDNEVALCLKAENTRMLRQIQQIYLNLTKNEITNKWNNGNGLVSGNLKDMYNSWLAYRNRYCSLYQTASQNTFGGADFNKEKCIFSFNGDHLKLIQEVIFAANSGGEEDDIED